MVRTRRRIKKRQIRVGTIQRTKQAPGFSNFNRDIKRKALTPGKRISKSGEVYWETRKNRSDVVPSMKI